jgi:hypothetical protein
LSVAEEEDGCAYSDQFLVASQQNIASHFLWDKPLERMAMYLVKRLKLQHVASASIKKVDGCSR